MHCDFLLTPNSPRRPNHRGDEALTLAPTRSDDGLSRVAINEQFAYQSGDHFLWWSPFLHWGCWLKSFPEQQSVTYLCLRENLLNHLYLVSLPTFSFTRLVVFVQGRTGIGCLWPRLLWFYSSTKKQSDQTQHCSLLYPAGGSAQVDVLAAWQVGRVCESLSLCACLPHMLLVSVSIVLSIMQLLTLSLTLEPLLSLPLNMHQFPSPKSLSPPSSHKLPCNPNSMLIADELT